MRTGRQLLLGLDVGTTATKAAAFDLEGTTVAVASRSYGLLTPQPGWVEQDPNELWRAVVATIRDLLLQQAPGDRVVALSLASQGGTTIPVSEQGEPIHPAISWMDERGSRQAARIRQTLGDDFVYRTTGWPLGNMLPLQHLGWLRDARSDIMDRAARFMFVNDFILHHLTGQAAMNPSDATMTQLFNIATSEWEQRLLDEIGLRREQLSPIAPSGHPIGRLTSDASRLTGLPRDALVVNGAHDQYCAAVGTGVTRPGTVLLSSGTAWVILAVPQDLETGLASGMAISCHAVPGRWGAIRSLGGVGASLEWLLKTLGLAGSDAQARAAGYAALNAAALRSEPGARGLLFYPLAGGHSRTGAGHGGFLHLALEHECGDMARAVMEGTCFELRWALDEIKARGVYVDTLTVVGGAATSPLWPQIIADSTGIPVSLPADRQAAARGAAILAGVGAGMVADMEVGFERSGEQTAILQPALLRPGSTAHYEAAFARYQKTYERVYTPESPIQGDTPS